MGFRLFLAVCAVACVVYTVQTTLLFDWFRRFCDARVARPEAWRVTKWLVAGLRCPYCLAHWVAVGVLLLVADSWREALVLWLPTIWLASHALELHRLVHQVIPFAQAWMQRPKG